MSIRAIDWALKVSQSLGIPTGTRMTLLALAYHHHDRTGACFPSYDTLAAETGQSRRKVIVDVGDLEANGLATRRRRRVDGHQGSNQVELFGSPNWPTWRQRRVQETGGCEGAPGDTQARVNGGAPDKELLTNKDLARRGPKKRAPGTGGRHA